MEVQCHSLGLSIRNDSNRTVPHSKMKCCGDSIKLHNISPSHLEGEYAPSFSMTSFKYLSLPLIARIFIFSINP